MKFNLFLITAVARRFTKVLHTWLTAEQMALVRERNKTRAPGVCHSHDFCDANMAMHEAWTAFAIEPLETEQGGEGGMSEVMAQAWGRAWDIALEAQFDTAEIDQWLERRKVAIIEAALNAACYSIQTDIGQDEGGVAGVFFTGTERDRFARLFDEYLNLEQIMLEGDHADND